MNTKGEGRLRVSDVYALAATGVATLLLAKNDSRLGQIVGRELDLDLVAGNDANEMLAHFSGNVGEDIALPGKIDPKHCARQHLRNDSFGDDLFFFRHRVNYTPTGASLNSCSHRPAGPARRTANIGISILSHVFQRDRRQILAKLAPFPPRA
jgi:hypothetical protein